MMLRLIGLSVVAMAAATPQPALAADAPSTLPTLPALSVTAMLAPFAGTAAPAGPAEPEYRLHASADLPSPSQLTIDDRSSRLRRGFGGAMVDYFPLGGDGFHISGGGRFYSRAPARSGTMDARGIIDMRYATLLGTPRSVLSRATRRMTPALTFGYSKLIQGGISLGIEGGAMLGRFDTLAGSLARAPRLRGAGLSDGAGQLSQITRMTFGYHF